MIFEKSQPKSAMQAKISTLHLTLLQGDYRHQASGCVAAVVKTVEQGE
jgi:hypothetical protein